MTKSEERIEAMTTLLEDMKIQLTEDQIKELTEGFVGHMDMEREMDSYQFSGYKSDCSNCKKLKTDNDQLRKERDIYHKSVCARRKTEDVWIEGDSVMYR